MKWSWLLATHLKAGARRRDDWWDTLCPAHPDTQPSLSIKVNPRDDCVTALKCHAGCSKAHILAAWGLGPDALKRSERWSNGTEIADRYDYIGCDTLLGKLGMAEAAQARSVKGLEDAVRHANDRYLYGLSSYYELLESEQQLFPAQRVLAQIRRDRLVAYVKLYKALGGGWNLTEAEWSDQEEKSGG